VIQFHSTPELGETLIARFKDNYGKEVEVNVFHGTFEFLLATLPNGTPVCCVARRIPGGSLMAWEDNIIRGKGLIDKACKKANKQKFNQPFDFEGFVLKVENHIGDLLCVADNLTNAIILCIAVKPNSEVLDLWFDADYRKSETADIFIDIVHGFAIARGWIAKGIKSFYSMTPIDNIPSNKYQRKVGCELKGQIFISGVKFNIYRYTAQSRIDRAKEVAFMNGIDLEF
jgi:hypothetical protein